MSTGLAGWDVDAVKLLDVGHDGDDATTDFTCALAFGERVRTVDFHHANDARG
jgi:hypothetical protein